MKCPVCGNDTFHEDEKDYEYIICPECFWEYDPIQMEKPDYAGGANCHSLNEYKKMYQRKKRQNPGFSCTNKSDREWMTAWDHGETGSE